MFFFLLLQNILKVKPDCTCALGPEDRITNTSSVHIPCCTCSSWNSRGTLNRICKQTLYIGTLGLPSSICSWEGLKLSVTLSDVSQITCLLESEWFSELVRERMALSGAPCLEMRKTAKPAIHRRSVYNLLWPATAKQSAAKHHGPLWKRCGAITTSNSLVS